MIKAPLHKQAFSLVELSIVLVILGLLTGGVLTGQSLIRAAELRAVTTEHQKYQTAVMTFRDKYFAIPGDMRNATDFWGAMTNCAVASPSGTGTETCNGDGDGILDLASDASRTGERFGFWQQLSNAGLIEGTYTGIAGPDGEADAEPAINSPKSKLGEAMWATVNRQTIISSIFYQFNYGNTFEFGRPISNNTAYAVSISPEEAWNIDTKIDDGRPGTGKVMATQFSSCTTSTDNSDAQRLAGEYALSETGNKCSFIFPFAF